MEEPTVSIDQGLILLNKAIGISSHAAVLNARRGLGVRKVGHTGTLDPFATGLLLLLVGSFTRLNELFHALPKSYHATLELGRETNTDDLTGETVAESQAWQTLNQNDVTSVFAGKIGPGLQRPSTFSAKRIKGERAYTLALRGESVDLEPRSVLFHDLEVTSMEGPKVKFKARVSTGTYIRALTRDVGRDLGCGAHLTELHRTKIGPFFIEDAVPSVERQILSGSKRATRRGSEVLPWLPTRELDVHERKAISQGRAIEQGEVIPATWEHGGSEVNFAGFVALTHECELLGVAESGEFGLQPRKVFLA